MKKYKRHAEQGIGGNADKKQAVEQVKGRMQFGAQWQLGVEYFAQVFARCLGCAFGPAELLALYGAHIGGELGWGIEVFEKFEAPAFQLGAVAQIEVLGKGIALPAASFVDGAATPDAGGAVEIDEVASRVATLLLDGKVGVQGKCLELGEHGVIPIDVLPPRLHHADTGILKMGDRREQKVGMRQKVCVKDGDEFAFGALKTFFECAGFKSLAIAAVQVHDVYPALLPLSHLLGHDARGLVGGVVEHLDLHATLWVLKHRNRIDQALNYIHFIVDRQLHRDTRPDRARCHRRQGFMLLFHAFLKTQVKKGQMNLHDAVHQDEGKRRNVNDQKG